MHNRSTWPLPLTLPCLLLISSALLISAQQPGGGRLTGDIVGGAALIFKAPADPKVKNITAQSGVGGGRTTGRRPRKPTVAEQQEQLLTKANAARKTNRDEAKKQYTAATQLMPTDARAFAGLGNVSIDDDKFEDAEKYYRKAIQLNPNYQDAQLPLAYSLARQGKYVEAIPIYEKLKQLEPKNPEVVNNLSAAYNATDRFDKGRDEATLAIELLGETGQAYLQGHQEREELLSYAYKNRGNANNGLKEYEKAADDLKRATTLGPSNAAAYFNLGLTLYNAKRYSEAIEAYQNVLKLRPSLPQAHYNLGLTFVAINDKKSARVQYEALRAINSDLAAQLEKLLK